MEPKKAILTQDVIDKKIKRIAYEIYEHNSEEQEIILAGIWDRGTILAEKIAAILHEISPIKIKLIEIKLDKQRPGTIEVSESLDFNGKVVVVVDDVANSGRTMLYAIKPLLNFLPKKIQTAVLVDRKHKSFPMSVDFVGYTLSTNLQEMVMVEVVGKEVKCAYLG